MISKTFSPQLHSFSNYLTNLDVFVQVSLAQVGANVSIQIFEEFVPFFANKKHEP